jgi:2'-5' RNA ligase
MDSALSKGVTSSSVRLFLAVELPDAVKERLSRLRELFAAHGRSVKWTAAPLLHITVRFLGELPASRVPTVLSASRRAALEVEPFTLHLDNLGAFPNSRSPRVLWVGLTPDSGCQSFQQLFASAEDALEVQGFTRERRTLSPHVTLGRVREEVRAPERAAIGQTMQRAQRGLTIDEEFLVRSLTVMRSILGTHGPTYTPLDVAPLGPEQSRDETQR